MNEKVLGYYRTIGIAAFGATVLLFGGIFLFAPHGPLGTFEVGKIYKIGYTYKATLPGYFAEARVFDFADRNTPEKSVIVPMTDKNGLQLVVINDRLPGATAVLARVEVPGVNVEGIEYSSGYDYFRWEYNPGRTEVQSVVPTMTSKKK